MRNVFQSRDVTEHHEKAADHPSENCLQHPGNLVEGNDCCLDDLYASLLFDEVNSDIIVDAVDVEDNDDQNQSATSVGPSNFDELNLKEILEQKSESISNSQISKFNICRNSIWEGTKRAMLRKSFSPENRMSVKFTDDIGVSEGVVDQGGPMREFVTLVLEYITNSELFTGPNEKKMLSCNGRCLEESEYFLAGQFFAISLVHCGIGPRCLSPILFECLIGCPDKVSVSVFDVDDIDIRMNLQNLLQAKTVEDAQNLMCSSNIETLLHFSGNFQMVRTLGDVKNVVKASASWYVLGRTRTPLESFKKGLDSFGILKSMTENPSAFKPEMCYTAQIITGDIMESLFIINQSEVGSNKYELENRLLSFWQDLLVDIEEGETSITFSDIIYFASGYKVIPPIAFTPELKFLHHVENDGELSKYPKSNTCGAILYLPTCHQSYVEFRNSMIFAILNCRGFGIP